MLNSTVKISYMMIFSDYLLAFEISTVRTIAFTCTDYVVHSDDTRQIKCLFKKMKEIFIIDFTGSEKQYAHLHFLADLNLLIETL